MSERKPKPAYMSGPWQGPGIPRLLLVDDDPITRRATVRFLTRAGFEVISVGSGRAAITLVEDGEPFDAAVVDLEMPGMDGLQLIGELYARRPEMPAGLWSASGRLDELTPEQLVHVRFVKHKMQPIGELVQAVCMVIYGASGAADPGAASGHVDGPNGERKGGPNGDGHQARPHARRMAALGLALCQ